MLFAGGILMSVDEAKKRIDELTERLNHLSYRYYVENEGDVSDYEYGQDVP